MKAEIISIEKIFDINTCSFSWQIVIESEDVPKFTLGNCKITQ